MATARTILNELAESGLGAAAYSLDALRITADDLRQSYEAGDMLAPFLCCAIWKEAGFDWSTLPDWVRSRLLDIAAEYYESGPHQITPRDLLSMSGKDRTKILPVFDVIAGLRGKGRLDAWAWQAEHERDAYLANTLDALEKWAKEGPGESSALNYGSMTSIEAEARRNSFKTAAGDNVPVLDKFGRLRDEVRNEVGQMFNVSGYDNPYFSKAKTVRRRVKTYKGQT